MGFIQANGHLLGQKEAKCPQCGGTRFMEGKVGPLKYLLHQGKVELDWKQTGMAYLCATPNCLRPYQLTDLRDQENAAGNGDSVILP